MLYVMYVTFYKHFMGFQIEQRSQPIVIDQTVALFWSLNLIESTPFSGLIQQLYPTASISGKPEKEFPFMATMGQMPNIPWNKMSVGTRHMHYSI